MLTNGMHYALLAYHYTVHTLAVCYVWVVAMSMCLICSLTNNRGLRIRELLKLTVAVNTVGTGEAD